MTGLLIDIAFIFCSIILSGSLVAVVEWIGHQVYPTLSAEDFKDAEKVKRFIRDLPFGAFVFVLLAWGVGATGGALFNDYMVKHIPYTPLIPGLMNIVFGIVNMVNIPHPMWFKIVSPFVCMIGPVAVLIFNGTIKLNF